MIWHSIDRIAVDTHGYTDFAMGLARLLGYDLCPRLKSLSDRLLYIPSELQFPELIAPIVRPNLKLSNVESQWDEFVRLAASIKTVTATAVLSGLVRWLPVIHFTVQVKHLDVWSEAFSFVIF